MPEERTPKLIMGWIPRERRKMGRPRKMWMEGVKAAMTTRNLEPDQWRNREEWRLVSGRRRQLLKTRIDIYVCMHVCVYIYIYKFLVLTYETSKINNLDMNYYDFLSTSKPENFLHLCDSAISNSTLCVSSLP